MLSVLFLTIFSLTSNKIIAQFYPCDLAATVGANPQIIVVGAETTITMEFYNGGQDFGCSIPVGHFGAVLSIPANGMEFVSILSPAGGNGTYFTVTYETENGEEFIRMINHSPIPNDGSTEIIEIILKGTVVNDPGQNYKLDLNMENLGGSSDDPFNNQLNTAVEVTIPLPIKLGDFNAKVDDCSSVNVTWNTYSEENFDRAEVQKSLDGKKYVTIGSVKSKGNGLSVNNSYLFTDNAPLVSGTVYYRLKAIDLDNAVSYSRVATAIVKCDNAMDMNIYPNPTHGEANITFTGFKTNNAREMLLLNVKGDIVKTFKMDPLTNNNLNINELPSGVYYLKMVDETVVLQKKFIKVN